MKLEKTRDDRRGADRFPIERDLRFKAWNRKTTDEIGSGKTINMSSKGVLFTTDRYLLAGRLLEISISWPAQLNSKVNLKLVARGRVVRCDQFKAAIEIDLYEFRARSTLGQQAN